MNRPDRRPDSLVTAAGTAEFVKRDPRRASRGQSARKFKALIGNHRSGRTARDFATTADFDGGAVSQSARADDSPGRAKAEEKRPPQFTAAIGCRLDRPQFIPRQFGICRICGHSAAGRGKLFDDGRRRRPAPHRDRRAPQSFCPFSGGLARNLHRSVSKRIALPRQNTMLARHWTSNRGASHGLEQQFGAEIHLAQPQAARSHHLRRSLRRGEADRAAVRDGRAGRSLRQRLAGRQARHDRPQVPRHRHGQFRQAHGGDRAGGVDEGRTTSSAPTRAARSCRSISSSPRWTISRPPRSPARCRRWPSCSRRASSSPICCATWTARSAAEDTLKKLLADPDLMAAMKAKLEQKPSGDGSAKAQ